MKTLIKTVSPRVTEVINTVMHFTVTERIFLAKLLLESVLTGEAEDEKEWSKMSLASFQQDWDNPEDAVYDNWRKLYGVPER